ncbi:unnamed protein product [Medioppia subpectinata]|uniref:NEDD8-activating enzyme E1 regulatory subunit n=2 Tax=Medioppia subpectinata TaxID=1979941 RepID=A0A7R9QFC2_9ACAR|nr:unnamed protein product [Medioppia subpectinata]CAG2119683.1 unnamed protein product [Medioppia subpectinata]
MSRKELSQTPFLVILYKYLLKWRQHFNRKPKDLPKTYKEKNELKKLIREDIDVLKDNLKSKSEDEDFKDLDLENFEEAIKAINTVLMASDYIPPEIQSLLNDPIIASNDCNGSSFWLSVKAMKQFVDQNHYLRLDEPFHQLKQYLDSYEKFEDMSRKELSQTPFLVILYKYLLKWRQHFNRKPKDLPKTFKEKNELKKLIREDIDVLKDNLKSKSEDEDFKDLDLENFEEAIKAINTVLMASDYIPPEIQSLLNDPIIASNDCNGSSFWLSVKAMKQFVDQNHCLPLRGTIPDMSSNSTKYIELQRIYRSKAKEDAECVYNILQTLPKAHNLNVTENDMNLFCKSAHYLRVVRTSEIDTELSGHRLRQIVNTMGIADEDTEDDELRYYLLMRLVDKFYSFHNRYPGQSHDEVESDVSLLKSYLKEISNEFGSNSIIKDDLIHEICRYGGSQLHSISAFIAGCAAQEAIKILTSQYIPIDNTFVYNGMTCVTKTYKL